MSKSSKIGQINKISKISNINRINNSEKSYNPLKSLVNNYLSLDEIDNKSNNKIITTESIPGFIDPSSVKSYSDGLPIRNMYDNRGKYFDEYLFNKKFDEYIEEQKKINLTKQKVRLHDLNKVENLKIKPYQLPFNKILINTKNLSFEIFDNIMNGENPTSNIKGDNLFYLGVLLLTITILYISISFIFD